MKQVAGHGGAERPTGRNCTGSERVHRLADTLRPSPHIEQGVRSWIKRWHLSRRKRNSASRTYLRRVMPSSF